MVNCIFYDIPGIGLDCRAIKKAGCAIIIQPETPRNNEKKPAMKPSQGIL